MFGQGRSEKSGSALSTWTGNDSNRQSRKTDVCSDLGVLKETLLDYIEENTVNRGCTDMNRHRDRQRQPKS